MSTRKSELKYQGHIIDSYKLCGGAARKWATQMMVGVPDLCCTLPGIGAHFVEVKHRPDWDRSKVYKNPLTPKQMAFAKEFWAGGAMCFAAVVVGASVKAPDSSLFVFDARDEQFNLIAAPRVPYLAGSKYDVERLLCKIGRRKNHG